MESAICGTILLVLWPAAKHVTTAAEALPTRMFQASCSVVRPILEKEAPSRRVIARRVRTAVLALVVFWLQLHGGGSG